MGAYGRLGAQWDPDEGRSADAQMIRQPDDVVRAGHYFGSNRRATAGTSLIRRDHPKALPQRRYDPGHTAEEPPGECSSTRAVSTAFVKKGQADLGEIDKRQMPNLFGGVRKTQ